MWSMTILEPRYRKGNQHLKVEVPFRRSIHRASATTLSAAGRLMVQQRVARDIVAVLGDVFRIMLFDHRDRWCCAAMPPT